MILSETLAGYAQEVFTPMALDQSAHAPGDGGGAPAVDPVGGHGEDRADRYERTEGRTTHRNGTRSRLLSTKAGT